MCSIRWKSFLNVNFKVVRLLWNANFIYYLLFFIYYYYLLYYCICIVFYSVFLCGYIVYWLYSYHLFLWWLLAALVLFIYILNVFISPINCIVYDLWKQLYCYAISPIKAILFYFRKSLDLSSSNAISHRLGKCYWREDVDENM